MAEVWDTDEHRSTRISISVYLCKSIGLLISCAERLSGPADVIAFRADPQDVVTFSSREIYTPLQWFWGNAFLARVLFLAITPSNERFA